MKMRNWFAGKRRKFSSEMRKSNIDHIIQMMHDNLQFPDSLATMSDAMLYNESEKKIIYEITQLQGAVEKDCYGRNLLMYAVLYKQHNVVQYLLEQDVDVNQQDNEGYTALHYAVQTNDIGSVCMLLKTGAIVDRCDFHGNTAMMKGNLVTNPEIFCILLKYGADPHHKNEYGITPVDMYSSSTEISSVLENI